MVWKIFPNAHFTHGSVYLLFTALSLILRMHLVHSIKPVLKLHRLHNLTSNILEMGPRGSVTLHNHTQSSLLLESYSLFLLLI